MTRYEKILRGAANYCAYYRHNPHRFVYDYLHIELRWFQKILIVMMNVCTTVVFIGARGIGKTFLSAIFCVVRCILWPGSKVCIASGTRGQAVNVLEKIMLELKPNSPELSAEIDEKATKATGQDARIVFKNGSYIKVVTASDSARGNRANVLLLDEFRMIDKDTVDTVLRKFLTQKRMPKYSELSKEERITEQAKEKNLSMYLSSAYWVDSWAYLKCQDTFRLMLDETRRQFVCGLPYQLSLSEGLLEEETVADEMAETDFSEIKFSMEYESLFWGDSDGAFFDFNSISKNRRIQYPMLPDSMASMLNNSTKVRIPQKQNGEIRILSADIALMSSKKHNNDASAIFVNQLLPNRTGRYTNNIVYCVSAEGLHTEDQALMIRRLYDEFRCDYIVIDAQGVGLGCFDCLVRDMNDPDTGEVYPALSCCNDSTMASRCTVPGAEKVIWSIKASAATNSDCAVLLREGFKSGKVRLLATEYDGEKYLGEIQGFSKLGAQDKAELLLPYINTTLLINELVNLQHEENDGGRVRVYEKTGMRKDRYSSLAYNYYVSTQLESKLRRRAYQSSAKDAQAFLYRAPKIK